MLCSECRQCIRLQEERTPTYVANEGQSGNSQLEITPAHGETAAPESDAEMTCTFVSIGASSRSKAQGGIDLTLKEHFELRDLFRKGVSLQGRYVIDSELGSGGMGHVYLARDSQLERQVAIKVIQSRLIELGYDPSRFLKESRVGANLVHPAIASVFDYGEHQGKPFTVFEYLGGQTLQELLAKRGRLSLDEVRLIIGSIAQALDLMHRHGIIHRDLKPENIRSDIHGNFKILDFGLARQFLNQANWGFAGTRNYASPEQAAELPCDGRSDQYALAVIAYELLTGRRPCSHNSKEEFHLRHPQCEPRLSLTAAPGLPEYAYPAFLQALNANSSVRFPTCQEFAAALGCRFLVSDASPLNVLRESLARWSIEDIWVSRIPIWIQRWMLSVSGVHLVLVRNAIWGVFQNQVFCWPIRTITEVGGGKKSLHIQIQNGQRVTTLRFRIPDKLDCERWKEQLSELREEPERQHDELKPGFQEPIPVLATQPLVRYQSLGRVEACNDKRWRAEAGLQIRAAMLGADAVLDVKEEVVTDFIGRIRRVYGNAVRTIDHSGRVALRSRWFADRIQRLSLWMLCVSAFLLASYTMIFALGFFQGNVSRAIEGLSTPLPIWRASLVAVALCGWPLLCSILLRRLRWPQLDRPAAIAFFGIGCGALLIISHNIVFLPVIELLVLIINGLVPFQPVWFTGLVLLLTVYFGFHLGKSAWREYNTYLVLFHGEHLKQSVLRRSVGWLAFSLSAAYILVLLVRLSRPALAYWF
jgi:hypothetical protein